MHNKEAIMEDANDKDFFGNQINTGDTVAFMKVGYRYLVSGIVIKKTKQMVIIERKITDSNTDINRQYYNQVIKKA